MNFGKRVPDCAYEVKTNFQVTQIQRNHAAIKLTGTVTQGGQKIRCEKKSEVNWCEQNETRGINGLSNNKINTAVYAREDNSYLIIGRGDKGPSANLT